MNSILLSVNKEDDKKYSTINVKLNQLCLLTDLE
jgi:hypothetical protein